MTRTYYTVEFMLKVTGEWKKFDDYDTYEKALAVIENEKAYDPYNLVEYRIVTVSEGENRG